MAHRSLVAFQLPRRDQQLLVKHARLRGMSLSALIRDQLEPLLSGERALRDLYAKVSTSFDGND